jgi:hypothetical protein
MQLVKQSFQVLVYARPAEWDRIAPKLPPELAHRVITGPIPPWPDFNVAVGFPLRSADELESILASVQEAGDATAS